MPFDSLIDPTKPTYGQAYTSDVRANFAHAKAEIEALRNDLTTVDSGKYLPITGGVLTGPLTLDGSAPTIGEHAASKAYVDLQIGGGGTGPFLKLSGGIMSGPLTLDGSIPTLDAHAASKVYVDLQIGGGGPGPFLKLSGGTVTGALNINGALTANAGLTVNSGGNVVVNSTNTTFNGTMSVGSSTATQLLAVNGAAGQNRQLVWRTASVARWQLRADAGAESGGDAGSSLMLQAYTDAGVGKGTMLTFSRNNGTISHVPYATVFSGTDVGTPNSTMSYNFQGSYSGTTSSSTGTTFNRWWVTSDTVSTQEQSSHFYFNSFFGPYSGQGGRTSMQVYLTAQGNMTLTGDTVINGFRAAAQSGAFDGGGTLTQAGTAIQGENIIANAGAGGSNWASCITAQYNNYVNTGHNLQNRSMLYYGVLADAGVQGGRTDGVFVGGVNPAGANTFPAPGMAFRNFISLGFGGTGLFPVDRFNGEVLSAPPAISAPGNVIVMPPQKALRGINMANVDFSEFAWMSPGVRIGGSGTIDISRLRISAGATGPIIDVPLQHATISSIASSGTLLAVGEQVYDHLGGTAIVDTVDGSGHVTAAHYLYPPRVIAGEVIQVASGIVTTAASIGATTLRLRNGTYGIAIGDTVVTANGVPGVPAGTTVTAFDPSQSNNTRVTLSAPITANIPYGTMFLFQQTMPSTTATFRTGSRGSFVANLTWAAATSIDIGTAAATAINIGNSGATVSILGSLTGTIPGAPTFSGNLTFSGLPKFQNASANAAAITIGSSATSNDIFFNGPSGARRAINWQTAGTARWRLFLDASNNMALGSFDTAGGNFSSVLAITANPGATASNSAFTFGNASSLTLSGTGTVGYNFKHAYTGALTGNLALWQSIISSDDVASSGLIRGHYLSHSFGGGSASGGRIGFQLDFVQVGALANGSNAAMIINGSLNNPGGTAWNAQDSQLVGQNWNLELKQGARYVGVYKAQGETDISVDANTRVVTVGTGSPNGTTYQLSFTTTATYQTGVGAPITTPIVVSVLGGASDTTTTIASKLLALVQSNDTLNQGGIGVSSGQVAGVIYTTGSTRAFSLAYADWVGMTCTASVSGGAGTLTVGAEVVGAGTNQIKGSMYVIGGNQGVRGLLNTAMISLHGSPSSASAGMLTNILRVEGGPGGGGTWPLDPFATAFDFIPGGPLSTSTFSIPQIQARMYSFLNLRRVNFTLSNGRPVETPGFWIDGQGTHQIGGSRISRSTTGLVIDASGYEGVATLASGGSGTTQTTYFAEDIGYDQFGGQYKATAIDTAGRITAMTVLNQPSAPAGAAPATTLTVNGGSGSGWTVSVVWSSATSVDIGTGSATAINIGRTASTTMISGKMKMGAALVNAVNDAAALSAGVGLYEFYRNGSVVMQRVS